MDFEDEENVEKSFFYDFDNEYIWEVGLFKYGCKTWVEVSIGYLTNRIIPQTMKVLYEGEFVFPNWVYSLYEIKKRYKSDYVERDKETTSSFFNKSTIE